MQPDTRPSPPVHLERMIRIVARRCISLHLGACRCEYHAYTGVAKAPATRVSWYFRSLRNWASRPTQRMVSSMDEDLCRFRMSCSKFCRSLPATAAAAPAAFDFVYPQVVRRKQMALAASGRYGRALAYAISGKAHDPGFGCFKARPRYQLRRFATPCAGMRQLPSPSAATGAAICHARVSALDGLI